MCDTSTPLVIEVKHTCPQLVTGLVSIDWCSRVQFLCSTQPVVLKTCTDVGGQRAAVKNSGSERVCAFYSRRKKL